MVLYYDELVNMPNRKGEVVNEATKLVTAMRKGPTSDLHALDVEIVDATFGKTYTGCAGEIDKAFWWQEHFKVVRGSEITLTPTKEGCQEEHTLWLTVNKPVRLANGQRISPSDGLQEVTVRIRYWANNGQFVRIETRCSFRSVDVLP